MNRSARIGLGVVGGIVLIGLAIWYWTTSAGSLPSWLPGHEAGSTHVHFKHGLAAFLLGVAALIYAWFQTGPKQASEQKVEREQ